MNTARIIERVLVYDGWYRFFRLTVELPGGEHVERHLLDNGSAVAVLPYDPERRLCMLIEQPRPAVLDAGEAPILEAIAGNLDGIGPEARIREEAMEEGGLRLGALEPVTNMWSLPPVSTERVQLYLAPYSATDRIGPGGGAEDEHEYITVHEFTLDQLRAMTLSGELTDAKTMILAQALLLRHPQLW
jgi:nudix-type nucleoside diphosphatase (YffH/AdpP family)